MCECDWESCPDYQRKRQEKIEMQELFRRNSPKQKAGEPEESFIQRCDDYWNSAPDDIFD